MNEGHHLIFGTLTDRLTGQVLPDTHDERYRQKIVEHLLEVCGYAPNDVEAARMVEVNAGDKKARFPVDFIVKLEGVPMMVVRYGPGSLVTRHRSAQALCLVLEPCEIPVAVVTNGEKVDVLDGGTGKVIGHGFEMIPLRTDLIKVWSRGECKVVSEGRREMANRLLYAYEVDGSCPCDTSICRPGSEM